MASATGPQDSLIMLWAGEDPALHSALLEELEAVGIPFIDRPTGDENVPPLADVLPIDWKTQFGFEVAVPSSNRPEAQAILEKLLNEEPVDMEIEANDSAGAVEAKPAQLGQANRAIWSGSDEARANFLLEALMENEIPARAEVRGFETILYVAHEEEARAQEIIREIVEGAPPA